MRTFLQRFLLVLALFAAAGPALAQTPAASPDGQGSAPAPVDADELQRLVDTLEDESRRKTFVGDLKALIAAQRQTEAAEEPPVGTRLIELLSDKIEGAGAELGELVDFLLDLPQLAVWARDQITSPEKRTQWLWLLSKLAAILAAGLVAQQLAHWLLRKPYRLIEAQAAPHFAARALFVILRMLLDLVAIAFFVAVAYGLMTLVEPSRSGRVVAIALINAIAGSRAVLAVARMIFAPHVSMMRLFEMSDETANYGHVWCRRLTYLAFYGYFGIEAITALGVSRSAHDLLLRGLGLAICLLLIMLVLQNRQVVANEIRGEARPLLGQFRRRLGDVWHLLAITYLITIYGVWSLEVPGGAEFVIEATIVSLFIVVVMQGLVVVLGRLIRRGFSLSDDQRQRFPGLEARANRYLPVLMVIVQVVIYAIGALAFLQTWGLNVVAWFATPLGSALISRITTIAFIVLMAMVFWEVVSAMIERYLTAKDEEGNVIHRGQRVQTLLPLLRNIVLIVVAVMVTLTVLSELGVDTGPLIAGAGILGLAVGFGAQTFVKDVITGFFILVEDSVAVGDLVEVGGHRGKVEAMSIRSIQLRDLQGHVHRVPFSEVTTTVNRSKVFSYAFFDIGVAYRESVDRCMEVIRALGDEFREDAVFGPDILEPIDIMGVQSFDDSAVIIRARIKVRPGRQLATQRAFNRLLKNRFDEEGIEIPFPHRTIYFGVDSQGDAPPAHLRIVGEGAPGASADKPARAPLANAPERERPDPGSKAPREDEADRKE